MNFCYVIFTNGFQAKYAIRLKAFHYNLHLVSDDKHIINDPFLFEYGHAHTLLRFCSLK